MKNSEIKTDFHNLIDDFKNEKLLESIYEFMLNLKEKESDEDWWNLLTDEQKAELDIAIRGSEDESNWVSHEEVMSNAKEWLKK